MNKLRKIKNEQKKTFLSKFKNEKKMKLNEKL